MANKAGDRSLIARGAPMVSAMKLGAMKPSALKDQCDSGFGDDDALRSESLKRDSEVLCSLQESTENISIEDPSEKPEERQPISLLEQDETRTYQNPIAGPLFDFARCNDVRYLLAPHREYLFVGDEDGDTALHLAVIHMQQQIAGAIVSVAPCKSYLDIFNDLRQTPLHLAAITRQPRVVQCLIAAGASVDIQDRNGKTPLHLACVRGDLDCVRELTRSRVGATFSEETRGFYHALNAKDYDGLTALQLAVCSNFPLVVGYLAKLGADVNTQDSKSGRTALHHAVECGNLNMTGCLIFQCKADVNAMNFDECTPLHTAAGRGMESMVALLLAAGADPKALNSEGESPQDHANPEVFEMLFGVPGL